jgi:hypothetical protein
MLKAKILNKWKVPTSNLPTRSTVVSTEPRPSCYSVASTFRRTRKVCVCYTFLILSAANSIYLSSRTQAEEEQRTQDRHHASGQHEEPRRLKGSKLSSNPTPFHQLHSIYSLHRFSSLLVWSWRFESDLLHVNTTIRSMQRSTKRTASRSAALSSFPRCVENMRETTLQSYQSRIS